MPGTLLVYDDGFPRAKPQGGPIRNTPSVDELRSNNYPDPYKLLPIWEASTPDTYFEAIADAAKSMGKINRFILFGHGRVVNALEGAGTVRVTTGIVIGAKDIDVNNARELARLQGRFEKNAQAELWVCEAAAAGTSGGQSGIAMCQAIADAIGVVLIAGTVSQEYTTVDQAQIPSGGWQSTAKFLPWEGETMRFRPRPKSK